MPVEFNLRHLEGRDLLLKGTLPPEELDLGVQDELLQFPLPLSYDLQVERMEDSILARGRVELPLRMQCARCLKPFDGSVVLPEWVCHLPLTGEDAVEIANDCGDLTPYLREDILLALPQHPLCGSNCVGVQGSILRAEGAPPAGPTPQQERSAWAELDKLKLE